MVSEDSNSERGQKMETWHELISQPKHKVRVEKDVYIKMRDGVRLAADIFRPDAGGKFPARRFTDGQAQS